VFTVCKVGREPDYNKQVTTKRLMPVLAEQRNIAFSVWWRTIMRNALFEASAQAAPSHLMNPGLKTTELL
jgi:hypothetical protein